MLWNGPCVNLQISTILGPATIILAVAQAFLTIFACDILVAYAMSLAPVVGYILICFYFKPKTQLLFAKILCAIFAAVMLGVLVSKLTYLVFKLNNQHCWLLQHVVRSSVK